MDHIQYGYSLVPDWQAEVDIGKKMDKAEGKAKDEAQS